MPFYTSTCVRRHLQLRPKNCRGIIIMGKSELSKLPISNSTRITDEDNNNATSSAWNNYVIVVVDGKFSNHIKCVKCDTLLKWKHRDGTSGLLNHSKSYAKNKSVTKSDRKLTEGFLVSTPRSAIPSSVKSEPADAVVMMCATDIR